MAVIKIKDNLALKVDPKQLESCLGKTYPWKWEWHAKELNNGSFLVAFPSAARISEVAIYEWVPLGGANLLINVQQWTDAALAAGKLSIVWVKVKGVPKTLKNFQSLCEVGSTIGQVLEVDMESVKKTGHVRIKVGVVDPQKIPVRTKITTPKLLIYFAYFKLEEIVEQGWIRPDEEGAVDFDAIEDDAETELREEDNQKRQKITDFSEDPSVNCVAAETHVQAIARTIKALELRDKNLREQMDVDVLMLGHNPVPKDLTATLDVHAGEGNLGLRTKRMNNLGQQGRIWETTYLR